MPHTPAQFRRTAASALGACIAMLWCGADASAQRVPTPNRIGESRFADQMREASQRGALDGSAPPSAGHRPPYHYPGKHYGYRYGYSYYPYYDDYWGYRRWDWYPYGIDGRLVRGGVRSSLTFASAQAASQQAAGQAAPQPAPEPLTDLERARLALTQGDAPESIARYRAHLGAMQDEGGEDFAIAAELAVALLAAQRRDDAVAMFRLAYASDPGLAAAPISERVTLDGSRWRALVVDAVRHANRRGSPASWLAVAVLMQAEGRPDVALRMVERARGLGLDESIAAPLAAALR